MFIYVITIHQTFLLARDWSKRNARPKILQLKLVDIWEYHPTDIPQFVNLISITISLSFKFYSRLYRVLGLLQKKGIIFFCPLVVPEITQNKTTHAAYGKLFVKIFSRALQNLWRIMNTIASILFENMNWHLSLDIICSWKLLVFLQIRSRKTVRILKQKIFAHKYLHIFWRQIEAVVYIDLSDRFLNKFWGRKGGGWWVVR